MIFQNEDDKVKVVINTCDCGCGSELHIQKFKDDCIEDTEYFLSLHSSKWFEEQVGIFEKIGIRLKRIWYILRGKDYLFMDICMSSSDFNKFIESLQTLQK